MGQIKPKNHLTLLSLSRVLLVPWTFQIYFLFVFLKKTISGVPLKSPRTLLQFYPGLYCSPNFIDYSKSRRESVVINGLNPKTGAREGTEHLLTQLVLVINIFLLPPEFSSSTLQASGIERTDSNSLFCVHISTFWAGAQTKIATATP